MLFHYGIAIAWAPTYALLRRKTRLSPHAAGAASATAMWLLVDEGMTPALGFSAPNRAYPAVKLDRAFLAHIVFGLAVAAVTETAWRALRVARSWRQQPRAPRLLLPCPPPIRLRCARPGAYIT